MPKVGAVESFESGMILYRRGMGSLKVVNPSGGGSHAAFARRELEAAAVSTELTYDQVSGDLTQANYSSLRAGKIEFRRRCEQVQYGMLIPMLVRPIAERFHAQGALLGLWGAEMPAERHLGTEVTGVRHLGTYACRNVNHAAAGRRSEHATANAIDISGFVLRGGREVRVAGDWPGAGPDAAFLRAVRDGACRWFRVVLGPDYNAAHRDHFHFDMGPWRVCR